MAAKKSVVPINLMTICAAVIVVAFFLPWVKFGGNFAGYEISDIANIAGRMTSFGSWVGRFNINVALVYTLILVPVSAVAIIVLSVQKKNTKHAAWVAATLPLAGFVYGFIRQGLDVFSRIGLGGWLTIAAAAVMLLVLLKILKISGQR